MPGLVLVALVGWLIVRQLPADAPAPPRTPPPARPDVGAVRRAVEPPPAPPVGAVRDPELAERVRQRRAERRDDRRAKSEPTFTMNAPGEQNGIAAFPPPGTKPVKRGIVVPDDFELPPGYVRHYQTTDDGRRLPPILMFHPDFAGVDANGNPIAIPADRIVPPELAPPGLGQRTLDETTDVDERVGRRDHTAEAAAPRRR